MCQGKNVNNIYKKIRMELHADYWNGLSPNRLWVRAYRNGIPYKHQPGLVAIEQPEALQFTALRVA